jgi:hypothetical protein
MTAWGILSTARINRLILAGVRRSDRMDVIAVASRDRTRSRPLPPNAGAQLARTLLLASLLSRVSAS